MKNDLLHDANLTSLIGNQQDFEINMQLEKQQSYCLNKAYSHMMIEKQPIKYLNEDEVFKQLLECQSVYRIIFKRIGMKKEMSTLFPLLNVLNQMWEMLIFVIDH